MSDSKPTSGKPSPGKPASAKSIAEESNSGHAFPDLYRLLSLKSLETDRTAIETALRRLAAQIKASQLADERDTTTARNAKLLELGKIHLLSTERKKKYDQRWQRVYGGAAAKLSAAQTASKEADVNKAGASIENLTNATANSELARLLPQGNPDEPFRLADYLQSNCAQTLANYDADFEKLQSLLGSLNDQPTVAEKVVSAKAEVNLDAARVRPEAVERTGLSTAKRKAEIGLSEGRVEGVDEVKKEVKKEVKEESGEESGEVLLSTRSVEPHLRGSYSKTRRRRKQLEQWILWGTIAGLAGVGGLLVWVFLANPSSNDSSSKDVATVVPNRVGNSERGTTRGNASTISSTPRRSGLPSVAGVSAEQDLTQNIDALVPVTPSEPTSAAPPMSTEPSTTSPTMTQPSPPIVTRPDESNPTMPPGDDKEPPKPVAIPPAQSKAPPPELTDADRTAWLTAMTAAKQLIGQQQYSQANESLSGNEQLAKTTDQQSQLKRLKTISRLAEELQHELRNAIEGLGAGEVVLIGTSTPVAFVDWDQTQLTVRIRGENRKFTLPELPIGLAFALSDMALDPQQPSTQARKAAFAFVHPGAAGNDLAAQRAKEMMSAAVAAGVVDQDLINAFNE